ncbi:MAG: hypothetical protein OEY38_14410 [Gammaproteobacteria bacterium]|nr:hypothetical protein [Gammaproteobacteria bacterium]
MQRIICKLQILLPFLLISCATAVDESFVEAPELKNKPPLAIASQAMYTTHTSDIVRLDGSQSRDDDGRVQNFLWTQITGPRVKISQSMQQPVGLFVAPWVDAETTYTFSLAVTDDNGEIATTTTSVNILPLPEQQGAGLIPPTAIAGVDRSYQSGEPVVLDGSSSVDIDGDIVEYLWIQTSGQTVEFVDNSNNEAMVSFIAPTVSEKHTLKFSLRVTDDDDQYNQDPESVSIIILPKQTATTANKNQAPVANAGEMQTVDSGETVILSAKDSSDADGRLVDIAWQQVAGYELSWSVDELDQYAIIFDAPLVETEQEFVFQLFVADDKGAIDVDEVSVVVSPPVPSNQVPIAGAGDDQTTLSGKVVLLDGQSSRDDDGSIAEFIWVQMNGPKLIMQNGINDSQKQWIAPIVNAETRFVFDLYVRDNIGAQSRDRVEITVQPNTEEQTTVSAGIDQTVNEQDKVILQSDYNLSAEQSLQSLSWKQISGPMIELVVDGHAVSFFAPSVEVETPLQFRVTLIDSLGDIVTDDVVVQVLPEINTLAPIPVVAEQYTVFADSLLKIDAQASSDPDGEIVDYLWRQIAGTTVELSTNPSQSHMLLRAPSGIANDEILEFELTVVDDKGAEASRRFSVNVIAQFSIDQVSEIDAASLQVCALVNRNVFCWGRGNNSLAAVPNLVNPSNLAIGDGIACVLDGGLVCWGDSPTFSIQMPVLTNPRDVDISTAGRICVLSEEGRTCWGGGYGLRTAPADNAIAVSVGDNHDCILNSSTTGNTVECFTASTNALKTDVPNTLVNPTELDVSNDSSCVLDQGQAVCWGNNYIGTINRALVNPTVLVNGLSNYCVIDDLGVVCAGNQRDVYENFAPQNFTLSIPRLLALSDFACGVDSLGMKCWGKYLRVSSKVPEAINSLPNITAIESGVDRNCVISDGRVVCWADRQGVLETTPLIENVEQLVVGGMSCARANNDVSCWADGPRGSAKSVPVAVDPIEVSISVNYSAGCMIDAEGVKCWNGSRPFYAGIAPELSNPTQIAVGGYGQCAIHDEGVLCWKGSGSGSYRAPSLVNPYAIAAGHFHTCALDQTGAVCWEGYDMNAVPRVTNGKEIVAGFHHACALDEQRVSCWGYDAYNQASVPPLQNPRDISAGYLHSCALDDSGVVCWGVDSFIPKFVTTF